MSDKIIENRKKNGWSQEELADRLGVSRQSVSKWEGAQAVPDMKKIIQMSEIFGVSTDYLLGVAEMPIAPIVITEGDLFTRLSQLSESDLDELENYLDFLDYKHSHT
mgnify:CR=1 FL=1